LPPRSSRSAIVSIDVIFMVRKGRGKPRGYRGVYWSWPVVVASRFVEVAHSALTSAV
jgi:hypothetical protein